MHARSAVSRFPVVVGIVGGLFLALTSVASADWPADASPLSSLLADPQHYAGTTALRGAVFHVPTPGVGTLMVIGLSGTFGRRRRRPA